MAVSSVQGSQSPPSFTAVQNPSKPKVNDHDGDATDVRLSQKAAQSGTPNRLLDVKA